MTFGDRLRFLRKQNNITQADLAKMFSLGESTISFYESNKRTPDYEMLNKFADYFNVSVDYLLARTDVPNQATNNNEKGQNNPLFDKIDSLNDESKKELEQYIEFLKIKEYMDKSKDETSSTSEKNA